MSQPVFIVDKLAVLHFMLCEQAEWAYLHAVSCCPDTGRKGYALVSDIHLSLESHKMTPPTYLQRTKIFVKRVREVA